MKTAVIYARVSTARQADDGISMDSQIEQCQVKALALDARVAGVFRDDGVSGRTDNRPGFQAALAYCAAHRVHHFICWSTSRFGRNLEDALKNVNLLREWGTKPAYVHGDIDIETDAGWMLGVVTGMMDEIYSRNIARDTLRSMVTASRDGFFVGGRAPFGYRVEKVGRRSRLVVDDDQADVVRLIFAHALEGGLGAQTIALKLNAGELLRDGKRWSKNTVSNLLKNPSYMGQRRFNQVKRKTRELNPVAEVVTVSSHPALVSEADFEKVQIMMTERIPAQKGGTPKSFFAFSGLLRCGVCGGGLQIRNGTGRNGTLYNYYACLAYKNGAQKCSLKAIKAEAFDAWMLEELMGKLLTVDVADKLVIDARSNGGKWAAQRETRRRALVKDLREAEGRRGKLYEVLELQGKDAPNLGDLSVRLRTLTESIRTVEAALRALEEQMAPDYDLVQIEPAAAMAAIRSVVLNCDDKQKLRALLGTFLESVSVTDSQVNVTYREDALLRSPMHVVRSQKSWLPVGASLRTGRVVFERPVAWPLLRLVA